MYRALIVWFIYTLYLGLQAEEYPLCLIQTVWTTDGDSVYVYLQKMETICFQKRNILFQ